MSEQAMNPLPPRRDLRGAGWCMLMHTLFMVVLPMILLIAVGMVFLMPDIMRYATQQPLATMDEITAGLQSAANEWVSGGEYMAVIYLTSILCALLSLIPFWRYARRRGVFLRQALGREHLSARNVLLLIVMAMGVNCLAGLLNIPLEILFNLFGYSVSVEIPLGETVSAQILALLYIVLIGPLVEEITFRGFLLGSLRRYGDHFAVVSSAVLFALMHGNLDQFLPTLAIGLLLGYVRVKTGSLSLCVLAHMGNNLLAMLMSFCPTGVAWLVVLVLAVAGLVLLVRMCRQAGVLSESADAVREHAVRRLYLSFPMVCYLLIVVLEMVSALGVFVPY